MLGRTGFLQTMDRERLIVIAITAAIAMTVGLAALAPGAAHASGCTDSWTNTAGGSWFTPGNWSNNAPPTSEEEACITANGTYTVTMTQTSGTVSVRALTVGGTSGTQTLAVGSSCSVNAILATTAGIANGADGVITLTNGDACGDSVTLSGPITNAGTLASEPAHGGSRTVQGSLTNTGTLGIDTNTTYNGSSALLSNKGAIDLAEATQLTVSGTSSLTNASGGSISATGDGVVLMSGTTFTEGAGTTSGTKPVIVDDGTLSYTAKGKSLIALHGSSALSGSLAAGQSLSIESTCGEHAVTTAAASFTNAGTITLTNADGCGDNATLVVSAGTLTNSGTITTEPAHGGTRTLQGSITNTGTLAIDVSTAYSGSKGLLRNEGAVKLAEATQLTVSNEGAVTNGTGGSIAATGTSDVLIGSGTSFTEGAGTTSGSKPVIVDDGALGYTGEGKSLIALHGSSTLSGSLGAEQTLSIESTCAEHASATAAASFANAGTLRLTNGDACGNNATLTVSAGTLTNSGKILTEVPVGGTRTLQGNLTNTGTLSFKASTAYNGTGATLTNEGSLTVAEGLQLTVSGGGSVINGAGGSITATGGADVLMSSGTSFTEGAGTTSGTKPVIVDDGALAYTGAGASAIALHGASTLSGSLSAAQSLSIESTCSEHAVVTAATGFANAGTITLTNGDTCGNNAILTVSAGTLTNSGKIVTEVPVGGTRTLQGNLTNTGTLTIKVNTAYNGTDAVLTNEGAISVHEGAVLTVSNGGSVVNKTGGSIFAPGSAAVFLSGGAFTQSSGGKTIGTEPVIVDDGALKYTSTFVEPSSGPIALRGASTLSGKVRNGNALLIESTCGEHAVVTAAGSFENFGKIELTNGDGCGNNATLNLSGGTLTNGGRIIVANPHGGVREIEGNLINKLTVSVAAGETLQVSGSYTQESAGKLKTFIAGASDFGKLSVGGTATLAGSLAVHQTLPFRATLGQTFAIVSAASLSGTFATETEDQLNSTGLYYKPTYSATGVTLVATQATLELSASSGLPGSSVTLSGSGYLPGDTITPTFVDQKGVLTTFPTVTTNGSGEFSTEITIPASAAVGAGTIKVTSAQTGVHIGHSFKVT
ncbi:MAG: beta strand repeat-containing protein [Solirubrobacteraceae bacterium]